MGERPPGVWDDCRHHFYSARVDFVEYGFRSCFARGERDKDVLNLFRPSVCRADDCDIVGVLLAWAKRGFTKQEVQDIATKSLEPAGIIILVTGAGGVFKQILIDSGVGKVLADMMATSSLPPIVLAFLIAAIVRVSQGSATVAMVTAAGLIAPLIETLGLSGPILGMIVIAIAAGATILSHVNDSGFWLVNRYFGLDVKDTLKSWTVMETLIALVGFVVVLILSLFVS